MSDESPRTRARGTRRGTDTEPAADPADLATPVTVPADQAGITLAEPVELTVVTVEQGGLGEVAADDVQVRLGGIGAASAETIGVEIGGIGAAMASSVDVRIGSIGAAMASDLTITQGVAGVVLARDAVVHQGLVRTMIAGNVRMERPTGVLVLLAARVQGDVRALLDWRAALAFGAGFGLVAGLVGRGRGDATRRQGGASRRRGRSGTSRDGA